MVIDGRAIADSVYEQLLAHPLHVSRKLRLGLVMVGTDQVIASFVKIKMRAAEQLGVEVIRVDMPEETNTEDVRVAVQELNQRADGIIVQLPLPPHVDLERVLSSIPPELDIDAINPDIPEDDRIVRSPVAEAIAEIFKQTNVDSTGKVTIIVGAGRLVGKPAAHLLSSLGAQVSVVTLESGSLDELLEADIVVLGAGNPGFVKPEMLKQGVVLIDAGTSDLSAGPGLPARIVGDADPACITKCSVFTPVPGGVGPISVAMIFKNLFELAEARSN